MIRIAIAALAALLLTGCAISAERSPDGTWTFTARDGTAHVGVPIADQRTAAQTTAAVTPLALAISKAEKTNTPEAWAEVHRLARGVAAHASARGFASRRGLASTQSNADYAFGQLPQ